MSKQSDTLKKLLALTVSTALFVTMAACGAPTQQPTAPQEPAADAQPQAQLPNPIVAVDGPEAFAAISSDIRLYPPVGGENVTYSIISNQVAQIQFTLDGRAYTYRAACTDEDISGVYQTFDNESHGVEADGPDWYASVSIRTIAGGNNGALARFSFAPVSYTLYTGDSVTVEILGELAISLAQTACPGLSQPESGSDPAQAAQDQQPPASAEDLDGDIRAMAPILDSVSRTLGVVSGQSWDGSDAASLWSALYLMGVNWGQTDARVTVDSDNAFCLVPANVMLEWAGALSPTLSALPELPAGLSSVSYDGASDAYRMELSDMGELETRIADYADLGNGAYSVSLKGYLGGDEAFGGVDFTLVKNPNLAGAEAPAFPFCVSAATAQSME